MKLSTLFLRTLLCATVISGCRSSSPRQDGPEMVMVLVPGGWYVMGSHSGPPSAAPAHDVFVSPFEIAMTEVTIGQFQAYVEQSGNIPLAWADGPPSGNRQLPVAGILWKEAAAYCDWHGLRLPTEAEWEKAARGTDQRTYPWGDLWDPTLANTAEAGVNAAVEVGQFPGGASPYGVLDMSGNVQEWVADYFDPTYYQGSPRRDPQGPLQVLDHGLRGGSWDSPGEQSTTFFRNSSHSVSPNDRVGLRCAVGIQSINAFAHQMPGASPAGKRVGERDGYPPRVSGRT